MPTQKEYIQLINKIFRGRRDAYGALGGCCKKKPLTDTVIRQHLTGKDRCGVYPLSPDIMDGSGVFWGCVDVDTSDLDAAQQVQGWLKHIGIPAYIERSKSKGFHVWVFFSEPIPANVVRGLLWYAVEDRSFEIFPKQPTIKKSDGGYGFGSYVNLPFFGVDGKEGRTLFLDPERRWEPFPDQSEFLKSIQKATPQMVNALIADGEIEIDDSEVLLPEESRVEKREYSGGNAQKVLDSCDFIQHCEREATTLKEEAWYAMICNLAPLDGGLELIHELSKPYSSYSSNETDRKIQHALEVDSPHSCEWIIANVFKCERDCRIKCPVQHGRREGQPEQPSKTKQKISDSNPYFEGNTFIPPFLGDALMKDYSFVTATGKIYLYTDGVYEPIDRSVIAKHCRDRLGKYARNNQIVEVVSHISDMTSVDPGMLNRHTHLLNLRNGMLDWESGELIGHSPKYLSTMRVPVNYKAHISQDPIIDILSQWVNEDAILTVQEFIGYCLLPDTRHEKALMLTGSGANGKSCFIKWVAAMMGADNTSVVPLQDLDANRFKRAEVFGKLLNVFADLPSTGLVGSSFFKTIVSGDRIDAERKGRDPFKFTPFAKLIYSANEIPQSPDNTYAYFRRWIIIDFPNVFDKGDNADEKLMERLTTDEMLSSLFSFALDGLKRLYEQRCFTIGATAQVRMADYQKANDPVSAFLNDRCKEVIGSKVKRSKLFEEFIAHCRDQEYKALNRQQFYDRIRSHRFRDKRTDGVDYFADIALIKNTDQISMDNTEQQAKLL